MNKKIASVLILLLSAILLCFFYTDKQKDPQKDALTLTDYKLNTYVSITIYDTDKEYVLKECMDLCDHYEQIFSRTDPESELYQLNSGKLPRSKDGYYTVSKDLFTAIQTAKNYATLSENAFSVAMEPLTALWNFTDGKDNIPSFSEIKKVLPLTDSDDILLKEPDQVAFSQNDLPYTQGSPVNYGMGIDLGGIAKGYIADRLRDYLLSQDINSAIIYLGGNVLCLGQKNDSPFIVGIEKPFDTNGGITALLEISDTSVVTSGTYQRYFQKEDTIYHHLLDSTTGYPLSNGLTSVTVITDSSTNADALSTTCFSLGLEKGLQLLENLPDTDGFFITEDGTCYYTDGFLEKYHVAFP